MKILLITLLLILGGVMHASQSCQTCPNAKQCAADSVVKHPEAAICGLYCKTCPAFGKECDGCLSSRVAEACRACPNGFRKCAQEKGVTRCYECADFPCDRLKKFSQTHIVNGIKHHEKVIDNLQCMKDSGVQTWIKEQEQVSTCKACGKTILWYERACGCMKDR